MFAAAIFMKQCHRRLKCETNDIFHTVQVLHKKKSNVCLSFSEPFMCVIMEQLGSSYNYNIQAHSHPPPTPHAK